MNPRIVRWSAFVALITLVASGCGSQNERAQTIKVRDTPSPASTPLEEPNFACMYPGRFAGTVAIVRGHFPDMKTRAVQYRIVGNPAATSGKLNGLRFVPSAIDWLVSDAETTASAKMDYRLRAPSIRVGKDLTLALYSNGYPSGSPRDRTSDKNRYWLLSEFNTDQGVDEIFAAPYASFVVVGDQIEFDGPCKKELDQMSRSVSLFAKAKSFATPAAAVIALASGGNVPQEDQALLAEFREFVRYGDKTPQEAAAAELSANERNFDSNVTTRSLNSAPVTRRGSIGYLPMVLNAPLVSASAESKGGTSIAGCLGGGPTVCLLPVWKPTPQLHLTFGVDDGGGSDGLSTTSVTSADFTPTNDLYTPGVVVSIAADGTIQFNKLADGELEKISSYPRSKINEMLAKLAGGAPLDITLTG